MAFVTEWTMMLWGGKATLKRWMLFSHPVVLQLVCQEELI